MSACEEALVTREFEDESIQGLRSSRLRFAAARR
jgi:hypothetical protein